MCGIAGLIHRGKSSNVGKELQGMLQALKHRGEDSTGYAIYGDNDGRNFIMRLKVGENVGEGSTSIMEDVSVYDERIKVVNSKMKELGAKILKEERILPYSLRYELSLDSQDLRDFSQKVESVKGVEILSLGKSLEVVKDLGNAEAVCGRYNLDKIVGTHAIGHARMATESGVDIKSAHPFWGYPFSDVSVVHNGQLTNYWNNRRVLEHKGMRFMSDCDSELIAVYLADKMRSGASLEEGMKDSLRYELSLDSQDLRDFSQKVESVKGVEILSLGKSLEVVKDLGNAEAVCGRYNLDKIVGTHAIGHARMATESGVDIKSAHPFWGYPFSDVSVVHNGQLTNYWNNRRVLEHKGMRFMSDCDSELIAVYLADKMRSGASLEEGMKDSLRELDGVFTYFVATKDSLGMAKDTMAAKPLVLYESDDLVAMGSEEIAIRSVLPQEIDTYDPFNGEVKVWQI